jgi:hypothetical protein
MFARAFSSAAKRAPQLKAIARGSALTVGVAVLFGPHMVGGGVHCASFSDLKRFDEELMDADEQADGARLEALVGKLQRLREIEFEEPEVLWRYARAAYTLATMPSTSSARRKELILAGLRAIDDARRRERNKPEIWRWAAVLLDASDQYCSTGEGIRNAYVVKNNFEEALAINPGDVESLHQWGRWCLKWAQSSSLWRTYARSLVAEPPSPTLEDAREKFLKVEQLDPGFWPANQLYLGLVEEALGHKQEAAEWFERAATTPRLTAAGNKAAADALTALKRVDAKRAQSAEAEQKRRKEEAAERRQQGSRLR